MYRIGILGNVPLADPGSARLWGEFTRGLQDLGYVEGRNAAIEFVSSDGKYERLPALAADLVRRHADVIVAPAAQNVVAAKQATQTIPIVMASVGDPVGNGLIASLARPGGNVTGTSFLTSALVGKQLALLKQLTPQASRLAILLNPANPGHPLTLPPGKAAAQSLGVHLQVVEARGPADIEKGFGAMSREHAGGLFVPWDGTFLVHAVRITELAPRTPAGTLRAAKIHRRGRPGLLRPVRRRKLPASCLLRGQDLEGRQARRAACRAADEVRARAQHEGGKGARADRPILPGRGRGRGRPIAERRGIPPDYTDRVSRSRHLIERPGGAGRTEMIQARKLGHVVLKVRDVEKSKEFYMRALGLKVAYDQKEWRAVFLSAGEQHHDLALFQLATGETPAATQPGLHHMA